MSGEEKKRHKRTANEEIIDRWTASKHRVKGCRKRSIVEKKCKRESSL